MKRADQKKLLRTFTGQVTAALLSRAKDWPESWDGHELRELVLYAFQYERTSLMRESRKRRKDCLNDIIVNNLY
ncbi:MAG: hypothetical protein V3V08_22050 [Nannocystaceae bacterium]